MATINQLRQERLAFFREVKRSLKAVDTAVESAQRYNTRILGRTRDVPETVEYEEMMRLVVLVLEALAALQKLLEVGAPIFNVLIR